MKDLVLVRDLEVEIGGGEISETARVGDVHLQNRRHFVRDALDQLGQSLRAGHYTRDQIIYFVRIGWNLLRRFDPHDREGIRLHHTFHDQPSQTLQRDLNGVSWQVDTLVDACGDADSADKSVRVQHIVVIAACHDQSNDQTSLLVGLEECQVFGRAHLHGDGAERIDDGGSKRHQWQRRWYFSLQDVVFSLGGRHSIPLERRSASVVSEVNGA